MEEKDSIFATWHLWDWDNTCFLTRCDIALLYYKKSSQRRWLYYSYRSTVSVTVQHYLALTIGFLGLGLKELCDFAQSDIKYV